MGAPTVADGEDACFACGRGFAGPQTRWDCAKDERENDEDGYMNGDDSLGERAAYGRDPHGMSQRCMVCPECNEKFHDSCAGNTAVPWICGAAQDYRCPLCLVLLSDREPVSSWTHLGWLSSGQLVASAGGAADADRPTPC